MVKMSGKIIQILTTCLLAMAHSRLRFEPPSLSTKNILGVIEEGSAESPETGKWS